MGSHGYGYGLAIPDPPKTHTRDMGLMDIMGIAELDNQVTASCNNNAAPLPTTPGVCHSSCCSCLIRARRSIPPPHYVIVFLMQQEGVPVVFWHSEEGTGPPCHVLVPNLTRGGGVCPSLSYRSHFNMTRRGRAPSLLYCSWFSMVGSGTPSPLCLHSNFNTARKAYPSSLCHCHFNTVGRA